MTTDNLSMPNDDLPLLISIPRLARLLGVTPQTAYAAIDGALWPIVVVEVGTQRRVSLPSVRRWLDGGTSATSTASTGGLTFDAEMSRSGAE